MPTVTTTTTTVAQGPSPSFAPFCLTVSLSLKTVLGDCLEGHFVSAQRVRVCAL
eukprot:m.232504 g.232504  ORF g.232504 m.232504 type:complete len:54 (+) comp15716_c1_seq1:517-678(+)